VEPGEERLGEAEGTRGMIVGTGIDITEVDRIRRSLERFGSRFLGHIYTAQEIAYCQARRMRAAESFATRFAAKEAAAKALGTGIGRGVTWMEIEVRREPGHAPTISLTGRAAAQAALLGVQHISLSLTHTAQLAMALVNMED
jgi:holo-[acyl-carrier protein] synthase